MTQTTPPSRFARLGGRATIATLVDSFYAKMLDVPGLARYFVHADLLRIKRHQAEMIAAALGEPGGFTDEALRDAHHHLGIAPGDLELTLMLFRETLEEARLEAADVGFLVGAMRSRARAIVED